MAEVSEIWCVAMVGARAAGKSTLARALAEHLPWSVHDGDELLAEKVGAPAGSYLAQAGEEPFRAVEEEVTLRSLTPGSPRILALGGGAVLSSPVREALGQPGVLVVFLDVPNQVLAERQQASGGRPPLTSLTLEEEVAELMSRRRSLYEQVAHLRLESQELNVDACCRAILAKMEGR